MKIFELAEKTTCCHIDCELDATKTIFYSNGEEDYSNFCDSHAIQYADIDVKKILSHPTNAFNAIDSLVKLEQEFLSALNILQSILDNPGEDQSIRIIKFISRYKITVGNIKK